MPIVFAQPEPTAYGESQGFIQQQNANRDFALRSFAAQSNDRSSRQASQNQQDALAQRRDEFEAQQQPNGRDLFIAQNQVNEQGMRIQAAAQMQEAQFTHADNIRLQRLRQGISHVNEQEQNGSLNRADAQAYRFELMTGIDPLERQRRAAQIQQEAEQTRVFAANAKRLAIAQRTQEDFQAAGGPRISTRPDPVTGEPRVYEMLEPGRWTPAESPSTGNSSSRSRSGGGGGAGGGGNDTMVQSMYTAISRETDRGPDGTERPRFAGEALDNEVVRRIESQRRIAARLDTENRDREATRPGGPLPFDPQPTTSRKDEPTSLNIRGVLNVAIDQAMRNRTLDRETALRSLASGIRQEVPTGAMSPQQQQTLQSLGYYRAEFTQDIDRALAFWMRPSIRMNGAEVPVPPERREDATAMQTYLAQYGSRERMGEQARRDFDATRQRLGFATWPPNPVVQVPNRIDVPNAPPGTHAAWRPTPGQLPVDLGGAP